MHTLDIGFLADNEEPRLASGEVRGRQYALQGDGGFPEVNGDQEWVKDGRGTAQTGRPAMVRDITVTYGPWRPASHADIRVHVFRLQGNPYVGTGWTWCREVNGRMYDSAWGLPKCRADWREVYEEALSALAPVTKVSA